MGQNKIQTTQSWIARGACASVAEENHVAMAALASNAYGHGAAEGLYAGRHVSAVQTTVLHKNI